MIKSLAWNKNGLRIMSSFRLLAYLVAVYFLYYFGLYLIKTEEFKYPVFTLILGIPLLLFFSYAIYALLNVFLFMVSSFLFKETTSSVIEAELLKRGYNLTFRAITEEEIADYDEYVNNFLDKTLVTGLQGLEDSFVSETEIRTAIITISEYISSLYYWGGEAYSGASDKNLIDKLNSIVKTSAGTYCADKSYIVGLLGDLQYALALKLEEVDEMGSSSDNKQEE